MRACTFCVCLLQESAVFLIGPEVRSSAGKILDGLLCSTRGVLSRLKMVNRRALRSGGRGHPLKRGRGNPLKN